MMIIWLCGYPVILQSSLSFTGFAILSLLCNSALLTFAPCCTAIYMALQTASLLYPLHSLSCTMMQAAQAQDAAGQHSQGATDHSPSQGASAAAAAAVHVAEGGGALCTPRVRS